MSEAKHMKLISFSSHKVNDRNSKESGKTVRISVILPESTEDKCPEFNYKDELVAAKTKIIAKNSTAKQTNGLDPFEDDDDVKRIAAEMEAKYGMGVAKKRKWRKDDYADIGMGYDESDSFIDNTDGYDEIIPKNTDEAVSSDDSSSSDEEPPENFKKHKRVLESSAESADDVKTESNAAKQVNKKPKMLNNANGMQKAIKKRLFGHEKIKQQMRKKRLDESTKKTVSELLREKRKDLNMTVNPIVSELPETKAERPVSPKEHKKPPTLANVHDVIESVINRSIIKKPEVTDESSKESGSSKAHTPTPAKIGSISYLTETDSNDGLSVKSVEVVNLPENLPSDIISIIDSIKNAAACNTEGKVKFFTENVNSMLLNLERKCRCLGKHSRTKVYEHLAPFVKCKKETLIKRAKNLCIIEEQKKIKGLIDGFKTNINRIMSGVVENYEEECRAVIQRNLQTREWCAWFSSCTDENPKNLRLPKRHFSWTEDLKKLLRDIVTLRKKCFINEGKQKESIDTLLIDFLKTEIQVLWPDGWMSLNILIKYSNIVDPKKNVDVVKKGPPSSAPELKINPPPNICVIPTSSLTSTPNNNIPISSNSALTITPVMQTPSSIPKVSSAEKSKPKLTTSDTVISKVNSDIGNVNKSSRSLPASEIIKASSQSASNMKYLGTVSTPLVAPTPEIETIILEGSPPSKEEPEDLSSYTSSEKHLDNFIKEGLSRNHCQIINLADQSEGKKKPSLKMKPKYSFDYPDKMPKLKPEVETLRVKTQEELTGSSALNQIIADSLGSDVGRFSKTNTVTKNSNSVINSTAPLSHPSPNFDYSKNKVSTEGDDIQKVMEGLKVLQKMSSPVKSNEDCRTSSPVSVIAFNKSFSQDSCNKANAATPPTISRSNTFQEAFQNHFIHDFMKATIAASTSKGTYNSYSKHNHSNNKSASSSDKYLQNANNNFPPQNSTTKVKSSYPPQEPGSYDMLDDMFANFLNEYGHSKTASSKPSSQHK